MFENESFFWLLGALLGGTMASLMAVREHRWLNRPLVVIFSMLISAWISALVARNSIFAGHIVLLKSASAAWCYPWICLTLLDVYRRTWISARVFPVGKVASKGALAIGPLALAAICVTSYMARLAPTEWAISLLLMTAFGITFGYLIIQMSMLSRPHIVSADRQRTFKRALFYPTIDGTPIKQSKGFSFGKTAVPVASTAAATASLPDAGLEHAAMAHLSGLDGDGLDIGDGVEFSLPDPHKDMADDLGLGDYPD